MLSLHVLKSRKQKNKTKKKNTRNSGIAFLGEDSPLHNSDGAVNLPFSSAGELTSGQEGTRSPCHNVGHLTRSTEGQGTPHLSQGSGSMCPVHPPGSPGQAWTEPTKARHPPVSNMSSSAENLHGSPMFNRARK